MVLGVTTPLTTYRKRWCNLVNPRVTTMTSTSYHPLLTRIINIINYEYIRSSHDNHRIIHRFKISHHIVDQQQQRQYRNNSTIAQRMKHSNRNAEATNFPSHLLCTVCHFNIFLLTTDLKPALIPTVTPWLFGSQDVT